MSDMAKYHQDVVEAFGGDIAARYDAVWQETSAERRPNFDKVIFAAIKGSTDISKAIALQGMINARPGGFKIPPRFPAKTPRFHRLHKRASLSDAGHGMS